MDEFWQQTGETVAIQQAYQSPQQQQQQADDDEFDFSANQNLKEYSNDQNSQQYGNIQPTQYGSLANNYEEDEITKTIREEEQRIQQKLQQKANQEYELKQKRKQEGRRWLQDFFTKKQQQNHQRKQDNLAKQQQLLNDIKNSQTSQGWTKVSKSVDLKQSEYKGSKDINRMREAIVHKKEDQVSL